MTFVSKAIGSTFFIALAAGAIACGGDPNTGGETHWQDDAVIGDASASFDTSTSTSPTPDATATLADTSTSDAVTTNPIGDMNGSDAVADAAGDMADQSPSDAVSDTSPGDTMMPPSNSIRALDQTIESPTRVEIDEVWALEASWVVVLDSTGIELGHTEVVDVGASAPESGIQVSLNRDLVDGETLTAVLAQDLGDAGVYEYPDPDVPALGGDGMEVTADFTVTYPAASLGQIGTPTLELSSWLPIEGATAPTMSWIIVWADDGMGSPDTSAPRSTVVTRFVAQLGGGDSIPGVTVWPPLTDGEVVHVQLFMDDGDGIFTMSDLPWQEPNDALIISTGTATVPAGTPTSRFVLDAVANDGAQWRVEPANLPFVTDTADPALTWEATRRYEVRNDLGSGRIDLISEGMGMQADTVLLSQDAMAMATLSDDADVAYEAIADGFRFTIAPTLAADLDAWVLDTSETGAIDLN